ncbi:MAG: acetate kinase [Acidobacteria bacterium]|jgi:acetate kinase|nr:acetate kinase [Acidobacteriota bacterium]
MIVLVLNSGSSSLKFQVIDTDLEAIEKNADKTLAQGVIERIGSEALINLRAEGQPPQRTTAPLRDHRAALDKVLRWLVSSESSVPGVNSIGDIAAVGHRVVHGGEKFAKSVAIDDAVVDQIEDCIDLAPLHNPANLKGIYAAREILGQGVPQVAVFDTSFHSTMPDTSYLYAIPYQLYVRHKVRRYGFHGTSHRYVAFRYRILTGKAYDDTNIITIHLGNGCSACAIQKGNSINTSMGLTPLEGLVMGTRGGNIDPSILEFLHHKEGFSLDQLDALLNKQSGLLGISGLTNDMRDLLEEERLHQDRRARLAIEIFCERVKFYIGAYLAQMNGADAIVFTGGIGENSHEVRERICRDLDVFGIALDKKKNKATVGRKEGDIATEKSRVQLWVIPTNEELLIARDTVRCVRDAPRRW